MRTGSDYIVLTEHPDHIHPEALSKTLMRRYGDNQFKVSLRRNIYVIYVNKSVADEQLVGLPTQFPCKASEPKNQDDIRDFNNKEFGGNLPDSYNSQGYQQRLLDTKLAEKVLRNARISMC